MVAPLPEIASLQQCKGSRNDANDHHAKLW